MKQTVEQDIDLIVAEFDKAMVSAEKSAFGSVSYYVEDLKHTSLYLRIYTGRQCRWTRPVIVISTINVYKTGKGTFHALLAKLKVLAAERQWIIKVENVLMPEFRSYLQRQDFVMHGERHCGIGNMFWFYDKALLQEEELPPRNPNGI
ncbi:hypothetical protein fHeYen902_165 [Yersinia phage fHe-Yen9-02]|nr:hypothetical protein fHeYen902_165 [Yersinia phage fHe-Yen9-02]